ncbi:hypothetical protein HanRHA438_Chr16g0749681 [Helianthus annuus]|nr:hypothetical protein HanIR_Chr16g0801651 [Helianthus annuus]KAJ0834965.1 hypothetical protein HanRHA438_Chr16g0749681 [Helianthus annuus]
MNNSNWKEWIEFKITRRVFMDQKLEPRKTRILKKLASKSFGSQKQDRVVRKQEREYEMVLKKTLQSICLLNVHPNTTTSIVIQDAHPDPIIRYKGPCIAKLEL